VTAADFRELMERLATAWSTQDTELALSCFTEDAVYMEPPDIQLYLGHEQLRPYFAALTDDTFMEFHTLLLAETGRTGAGEYSFGTAAEPTADHGVAVVELEEGRISFWREYQRKGPTPFSRFLDREGKTWQWHIGNYP
jgi:ketosteroid isomerase-like protein